MIDPTTLANTETKQPAGTEGSVFGGFGSALGGLLGGKTNSKAERRKRNPRPKDEMAFDDNEPVQQVGFESEIEGANRSTQRGSAVAGNVGTPTCVWRLPSSSAASAASTAAAIVGGVA